MFETPMENLTGWVDNLRAAILKEGRAVAKAKEAEINVSGARSYRDTCRSSIIANLLENGVEAHNSAIGDYRFKLVSFSEWPKGETQLILWVEKGNSLYVIPCDSTGKPPGSLALLTQTSQYRY